MKNERSGPECQQECKSRRSNQATYYWRLRRAAATRVVGTFVLLHAANHHPPTTRFHIETYHDRSCWSHPFCARSHASDTPQLRQKWAREFVGRPQFEQKFDPEATVGGVGREKPGGIGSGLTGE